VFVQLFDFKITDGSILFIKISESKNRWFRSFEKKKKKTESENSWVSVISETSKNWQYS